MSQLGFGPSVVKFVSQRLAHRDGVVNVVHTAVLYMGAFTGADILVF